MVTPETVWGLRLRSVAGFLIAAAKLLIESGNHLKQTTKARRLFNRRNALILGSVILASFFFYWFSIRPAIISKQCSEWASDIHRGTGTVSERLKNKNATYITNFEYCKSQKGI